MRPDQTVLAYVHQIMQTHNGYFFENLKNVELSWSFCSAQIESFPTFTRLLQHQVLSLWTGGIVHQGPDDTRREPFFFLYFSEVSIRFYRQIVKDTRLRLGI